MNRTTIDMWVGIFVTMAIAAMLFLALKVGNLSNAQLADPYVLKADFDNIGGLKVRAPVKISGVVVGRVESITLDKQNYQALVTMKIDNHYLFSRDTFATINTSGLLGEQYVGIDPGGDTVNLKPGDTITKTQSAVVLEKLISQFMFGKAAGDTPAPAATTPPK